MFEKLAICPPDPILGLTEAFKKDPNPKKINLGVGEYKDAFGKTPILETVKKAEMILADKETDKLYLPIDGHAGYKRHVQLLIFGEGHSVIQSQRAVTVQTPGGTGALRVGADFLSKVNPSVTVWVSEPTWPNHPGIFAAANIITKSYPYYDAAQKTLDFENLMSTIEKIPAGDVVLFHGGCHNPTGVDPSPAQWEAIANTAAAKGWIPFVDFAYQGFAEGIDSDATGVRTLAATVPEMLIASSFSKNFGLYNERVGALTLIASSESQAQTALGHIKRCIRTNYSNPPAHGAMLVSLILDTPELKKQWESEVRQMRERIARMRTLFVHTLQRKGVTQDFSFIEKQKGMFSFSGLSPEHVKLLREKHSIYIVGNGRINVAGMTEQNMDTLCSAIAEVLQQA